MPCQNLTPGIYEVIVEKEGFRRTQQKALELQVGQTARLDVRLEVGAVAETVEVTAAAPVLNTESAVKGDVVVKQEIVEMPLNGRSISDLAYMVPEVADASDANSGSGMAINGARNDNTNFVIDGINNNDLREGGSLASVPLDAVQEFKMQTSGYSAESGQLAGGVMTVALKTGGNRLHGSLFEFLRNDKFDARNFFAAGKDKLRRNQFGASLDGPVYIPRLYNGRDRTFFVFTWESSPAGRRRQRAGHRSRRTAPARRLLRARRPEPAHPAARPARLGQLHGRRPPRLLPRRPHPASRFIPVALKVIPYFPLPNRPGQVNNYLASANSTNTFDSFVFKGDHRLSANDSLSVRYLRRRTYSFNPFSGSDLANFGAYGKNPNALLGITYTHLFTPTVINELRGGFAREKRDGWHFDRTAACR